MGIFDNIIDGISDILFGDDTKIEGYYELVYWSDYKKQVLERRLLGHTNLANAKAVGDAALKRAHGVGVMEIRKDGYFYLEKGDTIGGGGDWRRLS